MLLAVMKYETLQVIFKHCVEDGNRVYYQENYRFHGNFAEILTGSFQSCWSPFFSSLSLCQNIYLRQANDRSHQSSTNFLHFIMEPFHPQLFFSYGVFFLLSVSKRWCVSQSVDDIQNIPLIYLSDAIFEQDQVTPKIGDLSRQ